MFILGMAVAFLGVGHYLLYRLHDNTVPFRFFLPCSVIMAVYAWGYGGFANKQSEFSGGLISARAVLRSIALLTSISFVVTGWEMQHYSLGIDATIASLCLCPGTLFVFTFVYALYAKSVHRDIVPATTSGRKQKRRGTARRTMVLITVLTMLAFLYNIYSVATALDIQAIWVAMALFCGSFLVCFLDMFIFQACVSVNEDRGVQPPATPSLTP